VLLFDDSEEYCNGAKDFGFETRLFTSNEEFRKVISSELNISGK